VFWVNDKYNCIADTFYIKVFTGIHEAENDNKPFVLFPNPGTDNFFIELDMAKPSLLNYCIFSVNGKKLFNSKNKVYPAGPHQIKLIENNLDLAEGVYFVTLELNGRHFTKKLVVIK
jgi:hypothetical protein